MAGNKSIEIVGAGLAGLIAACHFKDGAIREAGKIKENHKALLRFRDQSVSTLTGIPFKAVTVDKAIECGGTLYHKCDIRLANLYSQKVTGRLSGRSIWNLDRVTRYVAPDDLYQQLVDRHRLRIREESPVESLTSWDKEWRVTISTAPLPAMLAAAGMELPSLQFDRSPIKVDRYRLPDANVYQTIYFPDPSLRAYRASITGNILIVESVADSQPRGLFSWHFNEDDEFDHIMDSFGLIDHECEPLGRVDQQYGKIVPLDADKRQAILYELTSRFGVYSLGRFATWRNVLLDDVAKDIGVIDRLIRASDYERFHIVSGA